ncbi:pilus assembly protein TadG-related protein [Thermodesulfitimonas sp.]
MTWLREEKGVVLVLVAAALVALLGFGALVTDVGLLMLNRERVANAADAAALAGAAFLPENPAAAVSTAQEYALKNGAQPGEVSVTLGPDGKSITVDAVHAVSFSLARVLGFTASTVSGHAKAEVRAVSELYGAAPLGVREQNLEFGRLYDLKVGGGAGEHGNFGALALGGYGANNYGENLRRGYQAWLKVGDILETEPGNMSGPTRRAVEDRIRGHESCTWQNHCRDCPRIIYTPVYRVVGELQGRSQVQVVGFAAFFLDGTTGSGNDCYVRGYFIQKLVSGTRGIGGDDYGLRTVKLVE